jgi:hypothetical protein
VVTNQITTLAELEAVPRHAAVTVDRHEWLRTENGLARLNVDLPLFYFEGRVAAGEVYGPETRPPQKGDWWEGATRCYYLYEVTEHQVRYLTFVGNRLTSTTGASRLDSWLDNRILHRLGSAPEQLVRDGLADMAVSLGRALAERNTLRAAAAEHETRQTTVLDRVRVIRSALDEMVQAIE